MAEAKTESKAKDSGTGDAASFPLSFVKRETGRTHTIVTNGVQQTVPIVHGETGEAESEYALVATIDGVEVDLATYNSGRLETIVASQKRTQQAETEV